MDTSPATPAAPGDDRDPGAGWGVAVLLAWALLAVSGFWNLVALPMRAAAAMATDPHQALLVEQWTLAVLGDSAARVQVVYDAQACACGDPPRQALLGRLKARGVAIAQLAEDAARLPLRPEVIVLEGGRLRYAGPLAPTTFCTTGRHVVEAALAAPRDAAALVLPPQCACDTG